MRIMGSDVKQLEIDVGHALCAQHMQPFKDAWPTGYTYWARIALEVLVRQPDFRDHIDRLVTPGMHCRYRTIEAELAKRPICCWLHPDSREATWREVAAEFGLWLPDLCISCGDYDLGVWHPSLVACPCCGNQELHTTHLCLGCLAEAPPEAFHKPNQPNDE